MQHQTPRRRSRFKRCHICSPIDLNQAVLRRSPRIVALKRNQLCPTTNHISFLHNCNITYGEDVFQCAFAHAQAIESPYEKYFLNVMLKEIKNNDKRNHWVC